MGDNVTIVAIHEGSIGASHSLLAPGVAVGINLTIDVPSPMSGTGEKLLLDGHDIALLRASIVDDKGTLAAGTIENITFEIVSGPGRFVGVGNGDPASHRAQTGVTTDTYGGLARGIVQVSIDCVSGGRSIGIFVD